MKNQTYHTVGTVLKFNRTIVVRTHIINHWIFHTFSEKKKPFLFILVKLELILYFFNNKTFQIKLKID